MFFLQKEAIYFHGVFGFFETLDAAKKAADFAASHDRDEYHKWVVYDAVNFSPEMNFSSSDDYKTEPLYKGVRSVSET